MGHPGLLNPANVFIHPVLGVIDKHHPGLNAGHYTDPGLGQSAASLKTGMEPRGTRLHLLQKFLVRTNQREVDGRLALVFRQGLEVSVITAGDRAFGVNHRGVAPITEVFKHR